MTAREPIEAAARTLCESRGYDPDQLEPGNLPYRGSDEEVIDGRLPNGDPGFFYWRAYVDDASAVIVADLRAAEAQNRGFWRTVSARLLAPKEPTFTGIDLASGPNKSVECLIDRETGEVVSTRAMTRDLPAAAVKRVQEAAVACYGDARWWGCEEVDAVRSAAVEAVNAILAFIEERGLRVVPRNPNEHMRGAATNDGKEIENVAWIWRWMLEAAPPLAELLEDREHG